MSKISYMDLVHACSPGGSSVLTSVTELAPAGGPHTGVAPAKFVSGNASVFAYETRFVDGEPVETVIIDSKQSQLNRVEQQLSLAIESGDPLLNRLPRIRVTYEGASYTDLDLPHRAFDGHIRAGTLDGQPVTDSPEYRVVRDASPANARALLETSPASLVFGAWDSTRRTHQGRYRSALVGEIIGVLADQSENARTAPKRGGARVDPVAMSVQVTGKDFEAILAGQESELSPKTVEAIRKTAAKAKNKPVSASHLGLGGIPPSLDALGVVSCRRIIRSHVLSFSALRQLRFGSNPEGDVACRALLAAFGLNGLARSDAELSLRANCDLVELAPATVTLDERHGQHKRLAPLTIAEADALLEQAIDEATEKAGVRWDGQTLEVVGNPIVLGGAVDEADD